MTGEPPADRHADPRADAGPRVSVIIPTYKRPAALRRAVASAGAQTIAEIEVIVAAEADDPDSLAAIASLGDPRVRAIVNPVRGGPGPARDAGAAAARAPWIAFLDDDDEWLPHKLERQLALAGDARDVLVTALSRVETEAGTFIRPALPYAGDRPIDEWLFDRLSWFGGGEAMLQTSSLMVPRALFDTLGFGASRHEEWELVIRAMKQHGYRLLTVREPLVLYRAGGLYPWRASLDWAESRRALLTPRAMAGFCLTEAVKGLRPPERNRAFRAFARAAFRLGRPTLRQLFAFALIWAIPDPVRERLRSRLRRRAGATADA